MINGINSMTGSMGSMETMHSGQGQGQGPPPPRDKDIFQIGDSDGDGLLTSSELAALTKKIEEVTGNTISVEDALSSYDANKDGGLSGEELLSMLSSQGFTPPEMIAPQPPSSAEALAAYERNSAMGDQVTPLLELMKNSDMDSGAISVDVTT